MTLHGRSPRAAPRRGPRPARGLALVCALGLALAAWAGPVSTVRVDPKVVPRGGTFALPFGRIAVAFDPAALRAGDRELYRGGES